MTATKSERLLNLVILLLVSRNHVTKERIRQLMEPYRQSTDEAFEKMFERDKEDLRALGIPLEVGYVDKFFEDEQGYRVKRDAFELPALDLAPDEVAVLGLAARVWQHAGLAAATSDALVKLKAAGLEVDREQLDAVQPTLVAEEPAFEAVWRATLSRTPLAFDYRRPGDASATRRHLQPWGVVTAQERWYVVGLDTDRNEPRMFRLSRIVDGAVTTEGRPGSFTVPEGTDVRALSESLAPPGSGRTATLLVRPGAALALRRRAEPLGRHDAGRDRLRVPYGSAEQLVGEILALGDAVVVEEPEELRAEVVQRLRALVIAGTAGTAGTADGGGAR
ncbi:MAG TPA: WYL domain-containing protein [Marmoricola sp.]|nr:WYL domain-containing protein [Marmoricola sp.]